MGQQSSNIIDVGKLIDSSRFTAFQKRVVFIAALSIILDGFDGQMIGFALPSILKEWGIPRGAFAPVVAAGLIGMAFGSAVAGLLADKFGRRWILIISVFTFGITTSCTGLVQDLNTMIVLRFFAGLGIGGALPSSTTVTAEFTPAKWRAFFVTATIVLYPLGGMLGGFYAGKILSIYGWQELFITAGLLPILFSIVLIFTLPESPRFLVRHKERWAELGGLLRKMNQIVPANSEFVDVVEQKKENSSGFKSLFSTQMRRNTFAIWCALFMCMMASYTVFSWLPTMLTSMGLSGGQAIKGLTAFNLGGVFGAILCALFITRFGSKWPLLICSAGAALTAFVMQNTGVLNDSIWMVAGFAVLGLFVNAVQSTIYALCAHIYPTTVRGTGTAAALTFGRFGAILSAFAGAAVITLGGSYAYLGLIAGAMAFSFIGLVLVSNHISKVD